MFFAKLTEAFSNVCSDLLTATNSFARRGSGCLRILSSPAVCVVATGFEDGSAETAFTTTSFTSFTGFATAAAADVASVCGSVLETNPERAASTFGKATFVAVKGMGFGFNASNSAKGSASLPSFISLTSFSTEISSSKGSTNFVWSFGTSSSCSAILWSGRASSSNKAWMDLVSSGSSSLTAARKSSNPRKPVNHRNFIFQTVRAKNTHRLSRKLSLGTLWLALAVKKPFPTKRNMTWNDEMTEWHMKCMKWSTPSTIRRPQSPCCPWGEASRQRSFWPEENMRSGEVTTSRIKEELMNV